MQMHFLNATPVPLFIYLHDNLYLGPTITDPGLGLCYIYIVNSAIALSRVSLAWRQDNLAESDGIAPPHTRGASPQSRIERGEEQHLIMLCPPQLQAQPLRGNLRSGCASLTPALGSMTATFLLRA